MDDTIILTFSGDLKSIDEVVRKIDPTANTFDCYCRTKGGGWDNTNTHILTCFWCSAPGTFEMKFKRDGNDLRKIGSTSRVSSKLKAIESIL